MVISCKTIVYCHNQDIEPDTIQQISQSLLVIIYLHVCVLSSMKTLSSVQFYVSPLPHWPYSTKSVLQGSIMLAFCTIVLFLQPPPYPLTLLPTLTPGKHEHDTFNYSLIILRFQHFAVFNKHLIKHPAHVLFLCQF